MEMIRARNQQAALPALLQSLYTDGEQHADQLLLDHPVVFTFERPRERLIFWPGIRRNPAGELAQALTSLQAAEPHMEQAAQAVVQGNQRFMYHNPQMVVQVRDDGAGRMDLYAILTDPNPFTGAFGGQALQLSVLLELLAQAGKRQVGELTVQHQQLQLPANVVAQLMKGSLEAMPANPYADGLKPRKIDGPLDLGDTLKHPEVTMGHRSKWVRHVAGPLLVAGKADSPQQAAELAKRIKAEDWRRAMIEWCEAAAAAEEFQKAQGDARGEG